MKGVHCRIDSTLRVPPIYFKQRGPACIDPALPDTTFTYSRIFRQSKFNHMASSSNLQFYDNQNMLHTSKDLSQRRVTLPRRTRQASSLLEGSYSPARLPLRHLLTQGASASFCFG